MALGGPGMALGGPGQAAQSISIIVTVTLV